MSEREFKLSPYRWVVLAVFMFINLTIQLLWISYAPISSAAGDYMGVSDLQIGFLAMSFMIAFIPLSIPASWLIDTYGIRVAVSIGAVLMGVFGLARGLAGANWGLVLGSTIGIAIAQPFLLNAWTAVPARWFSIDERATAVGLVTLSNLVGTGLGMVLTPLLIETLTVSQVQLIYGGIAAFLAGALSSPRPGATAHTARAGRDRRARPDAGWPQTCPKSQTLLVLPGGLFLWHGDL